MRLGIYDTGQSAMTPGLCKISSEGPLQISCGVMPVGYQTSGGYTRKSTKRGMSSQITAPLNVTRRMIMSRWYLE